MNKFWDWMQKNKYGELDIIIDKPFVTYHHNFYQSATIPAMPQMLVGYMLEYIKQHDFFNIHIDHKADKIISKLFELILSENMYAHLESIINEIDSDCKGCGK